MARPSSPCCTWHHSAGLGQTATPSNQVALRPLKERPHHESIATSDAMRQNVQAPSCLWRYRTWRLETFLITKARTRSPFPPLGISYRLEGVIIQERSSHKATFLKICLWGMLLTTNGAESTSLEFLRAIDYVI